MGQFWGAHRPSVSESAHTLGEALDSDPLVVQVKAFVLQLGLSAAAYNATLAAMHRLLLRLGPKNGLLPACVLVRPVQLGAGCLRVSCATPVLGSAVGCMAVAVSSAAAGHVGQHTRAALHDSSNNVGGALASLPWRLLRFSRQDMLLDALAGPLLFKLCRGEFRRVLPSHLAKPGAFGYVAVPTSPRNEYASQGEKSQLQAIFKVFGCHHCGSWHSSVLIGDHIPPYKMVQLTKEAAKKLSQAAPMEKWLGQVASAMGLKDTSLKQVYYPQCQRCCSEQSQLMRNLTRATWLNGCWPPALVIHDLTRLATNNAVPGVLVAQRYGSCAQPPPERSWEPLGRGGSWGGQDVQDDGERHGGRGRRKHLAANFEDAIEAL